MTATLSELEADVVLRTGRTLHIRQIRPEDGENVRRFYSSLTPESLYSRFFDLRTPEQALRSSPASPGRGNVGIVAEMGGEIVGVAHYFVVQGRTDIAEVALAVSDAVQGCGAGTKLLETLIDAARENGIATFEALTLPGNRRMLDVFFGTGFEVARRFEDGTLHLSFPIAPTAAAEERAAQRSQTAAYASMKSIFAPASIAVIGASKRPGQLGHEIVHNLRASGFSGSLYAVNRNAADVDSVPSYPSLSAIGAKVELAIIAVPATQVGSVLDDCIAAGVAAVVVISAGFAETGAEGRRHEEALLEKVRRAGIRMVGPNCMGVLNADPAVRMHGTFAPVFPPAGSVAMSSQSGALGLAVLDYAKALNIGFSTFISVGNKADVSGNDLIQYWAEDPKTEVILLYLESFGNPRKFGEIARRVGKKKPIVAVKAGRSEAGARAASSHTGALATSDAIVDDLFRQAGIIRTGTLEEMFDVAALLANQPLPRGRRVAILTNAGGPGILAADACEASGLELARLSDETAAELRSFLPAAASVGNPIDMIASATPDQYRRSLELLVGDEAIDAVVVIYIPVLPKDADTVAAAIREASANAGGKAILTTFMRSAGTPPVLAPVPAFAFPERAVNALALATRYAEWKRRPSGDIPKFFDIDAAALREIIGTACDRGGGWLDPVAVGDVLRHSGLTAPPLIVARSAEEAEVAAFRMGFPVVLKAYGPRILHKSDSGGVKLSLGNESAVRTAFEEMVAAMGAEMTGAIVQPMIGGGVEMMIGATYQPAFGHVVACGAGGTLVELLADVAFRVHPLTDRDAADLIAALRSARLLRGFRGAPAADIGAFQDAILRVSALLEICPEIRELDLNPLKVLPEGVAALDARIRVERLEGTPPSRRVSY